MDWESVEPISKTRLERKRRLRIARGAHKNKSPSSDGNAAVCEQRETSAAQAERLDDGPLESLSARLAEHDIESVPSERFLDRKSNGNTIDRYACDVAAKYEAPDDY